MPPVYSLIPQSLTVAVALAGSALVACAPSQTPPSMVIAANVPNVAPSAPSAVVESEAPPLPAGQLACRTKTVAEGTAELFLEWSGTSATGVLRRVAPSGEVYLQPVRAERVKGTIIADDPASSDLVVHAATIHEQDGKRYIRLGDYRQSWSACE